MAMGMTYVKSDSLSVVISDAVNPAAVEIDLGLGIDEAARILGVGISVSPGAFVPGAGASRGEVAVSFDPEDTIQEPNSDEQFVYDVVCFNQFGAEYGAKTSEAIFHNFAGMNLVTTRNLALILYGAVSNMTAASRIYYEKFKPSVTDLNQLIATRR
ncbi:hypothetical protein ES708_33469 [subsurface metagenome]